MRFHGIGDQTVFLRGLDCPAHAALDHVLRFTCDTCKKNAADHGWCEGCKAGMVGPIMFKDKAAYDAAVKARTILVEAAKNKCDACAVAMVTDGKCVDCKVSYKDGKKVEAAKP